MKRQKLEDLLPGAYSKGAKYVLLRKVDAKEAMGYALLHSDRDIIEYLRNDEIWKFWFQRDLFPDIPMWFPQEGETPVWKRFYLWYRLLIGALQWMVIRTWNEEYIRYVQFNVIEIENLHMDFRPIFTHFTSLPYTYKNLSESVTVGTTPNNRKIGPGLVDYRNFIRSRYNIDSLSFGPILNLLYWQTLSNPNNINDETRKQYSSIVLLKKIPRINERIVVACNVCQSIDAQYKCSQCEKPYCSEVCAKKDWDNNKCT